MSNISVPPTAPLSSTPPAQSPPPQFAAPAAAFTYPPPAPGSAAPAAQQGWPLPTGTPLFAGPHQSPAPTGAVKPSPLWPLTIIACLGSLLFGGIGLYFSSQVKTKWAAGDAAGARKASRVAMVLGICGIASGLLFWLVVIIAVVASGGTPTTY